MDKTGTADRIFPRPTRGGRANPLEDEGPETYTGCMNKADLLGYLERLDRALQAPASLYIYGSGACILLDEPDRTSLHLDVAGPYSEADEGDLRRRRRDCRSIRTRVILAIISNGWVRYGFVFRLRSKGKS